MRLPSCGVLLAVGTLLSQGCDGNDKTSSVSDESNTEEATLGDAAAQDESTQDDSAQHDCASDTPNADDSMPAQPTSSEPEPSVTQEPEPRPRPTRPNVNPEPVSMSDAGDASSSMSADDGETSQGGELASSAPIEAGSSLEPAPTTGLDAGSATRLCEGSALEWHSANKTNYESYPDPGSQECIEFNGCMWEGQFAACDDKMSEQWVSEHNIVAAFPSFGALELHDLCLRQGNNTIVVTVYDTCGDSDCDGCCTLNQGDAEQLIDVESYTNARWGVEDGPIEWADLGPTTGDGCN